MQNVDGFVEIAKSGKWYGRLNFSRPAWDLFKVIQVDNKSIHLQSNANSSRMDIFHGGPTCDYMSISEH